MNDPLPPAGWRERYRAWRLVVGVAWRAGRLRASFAVVATALSHLWRLVWAVAIGRMTQGIVESDASAALTGVWLLGGWSVLSGLIEGFAFEQRMVLRERATHQLDLELIELTTGIAGVEHFERPRYADRLEALLNTRHQLAGAFDALTMNVATGVSIIASLGVLATVHPILTLLPIAGLPSVWVSARSSRRVEATRDAAAPDLRLITRLRDIAASPVAGKELRLFGAAPELVRRHHETSRRFERRWVSTSLRNTAEGLVGQVVFTAGFVAAIAVLVRSSADGNATPGEVAAALTVAATIQDQVRQLVSMASWLRSCAEAARRYGWLVDHARGAAAIDVPTDPAPAPARLTSGIELHGVTFRYPGTEVDVLRDVDLAIPAGSIVAIVGDNGAGKSTLVKLLGRYYEPTRGSITVDGVPLHQIPAGEWRQRLSAAFQDHLRLELQASHAVGVGQLAGLDDQAAQLRALDRAAASDLVTGLPDGLATQLGRAFADGHELSGGQWQQIALGRAMMRAEPLLLLLDEPTAALDADAEHALFDRYSTAAREAAARTGAITLLVSHRFSTVRAADLIVVVDRHGISEHGSHDELMARGGTYAELFDLQASSYR